MNKYIIIIPTIGLITSIVITFFVMSEDVLVFDTVIREYIYSIRSNGLTLFLTYITYLGNWQTISLICIIFLLYKHTRISFGIPLVAAAVLSTIIKDALKVIFQRQRPDLVLHLINQGGYSFPSGHSMISLVFYGMLIYLCHLNINNKTVINTITVLLSILTFLIGFSRIYLGVHYPTDVVGGWSFGIFLLFIIISLYSLRKDTHRSI